MILASVRQPSNEDWFGWDEVSLQDLEGNQFEYLPTTKWVEAVCSDDDLGLYVLRTLDDKCFTCPSVDLEFEEK